MLVTKYMAPTTKKKSENGTHKNRHPEFEPPPLSSQGRMPTGWSTLFIVYVGPDWYVSTVYVRIDAWDILTKKRVQQPSPGDDASTAEAAPGRVGRGEQGEARRATSKHEQTAHRMVDLTSSYGVYGSKPGINLTSRLLRRQGQHIIHTCTCAYIYVPRSFFFV